MNELKCAECGTREGMGDCFECSKCKKLFCIPCANNGKRLTAHVHRRTALRMYPPVDFG